MGLYCPFCQWKYYQYKPSRHLSTMTFFAKQQTRTEYCTYSKWMPDIGLLGTVQYNLHRRTCLCWTWPSSLSCSWWHCLQHHWSNLTDAQLDNNVKVHNVVHDEDYTVVLMLFYGCKWISLIQYMHWRVEGSVLASLNQFINIAQSFFKQLLKMHSKTIKYIDARTIQLWF